MLMLKTTLSLLMFQLSTTRWKHNMGLNLKGNLQSAQRSLLIKTLGGTKMFSINYDCFNQFKKSSYPLSVNLAYRKNVLDSGYRFAKLPI